MRRLNERMHMAETVLEALCSQPLCRTELKQRTARKIGTNVTFEGILNYLVQGGFVEKRGIESYANYTITEKGAKLLEATR